MPFEETAMKKYVLFALIYLFILALITSCGGGGGGGGGAVALQEKSSLHNGGDAGGWGSSNSGGGSNNEVEVTITGGTPLNVTGYTYNGTTYPDADSLINVLTTSTLPDSFTVEFTVDVDGTTETRTARVSANGTAGNGQDIYIEHQYKATIITEDGETQEISFYKRDGISLASFSTSDATGTGGVTFDQTGWTDGNAVYPTNGALPYPSSENGDIVVSGLLRAYDKMKVSDGTLSFYEPMINTGDSFIIPAGETVNEVCLPDSLISLDLSSASLPSTIDGSFLGESNLSSLKEIKLPNSVTTIDNGTFQNCESLESVNLPNGLQMIGDNAFDGCYSLQSITIPGSVDTIGEMAFADCYGLESITINNGVKHIGFNAFLDCYNPELKNIVIPNSVESIDDGAFEGCDYLQTVTLPTNPSFTTISYGLFNGCANLETVNIPDGVTTIEGNAFCDCIKLRNVNGTNRIDLPSTIATIKQGAFENSCSDSSLASTGVNLWFYSNPTLEQDAFNGCTYITFLRSQADSFTPAANAFSNCSNLNDIVLYNPMTITLDSNMFSGLNSGKRVLIALGSLRSYVGGIMQDKSITLTGTSTFEKTPHLNSNTTPLPEQFNITGLTWGGKSVIIKPDSSFDYYKWNGTDFEGSTVPAEWND